MIFNRGPLASHLARNTLGLKKKKFKIKMSHTLSWDLIKWCFLSFLALSRCNKEYSNADKELRNVHII